MLSPSMESLFLFGASGAVPVFALRPMVDGAVGLLATWWLDSHLVQHVSGASAGTGHQSNIRRRSHGNHLSGGGRCRFSSQQLRWCLFRLPAVLSARAPSLRSVPQLRFLAFSVHWCSTGGGVEASPSGSRPGSGRSLWEFSASSCQGSTISAIWVDSSEGTLPLIGSIPGVRSASSISWRR